MLQLYINIVYQYEAMGKSKLIFPVDYKKKTEISFPPHFGY